VRFAETKNGALVVLGDAAITAIVTYLATILHPRLLVLIGFLIGALFLFVSLVIALISFLAQQDFPKILQQPMKQEPVLSGNVPVRRYVRLTRLSLALRVKLLVYS